MLIEDIHYNLNWTEYVQNQPKQTLMYLSLCQPHTLTTAFLYTLTSSQVDLHYQGEIFATKNGTNQVQNTAASLQGGCVVPFDLQDEHTVAPRAPLVAQGLGLSI